MELEQLIKAINEHFPPKDGGYNSAIFFHHDKDGKLKTFSPLIGGDVKNLGTMAEKLLLYSDACKQMANKIISEHLPKS